MSLTCYDLDNIKLIVCLMYNDMDNTRKPSLFSAQWQE